MNLSDIEESECTASKFEGASSGVGDFKSHGKQRRVFECVACGFGGSNSIVGNSWLMGSISNAWHMVSWVVGATLAIRVAWPAEVGVQGHGMGI